MRIAPDDEVYRINAVWLGPRGMTFPWTARYLAYATWLAVFCLILLVEALTPLQVGVPPVWEVCIAVLVTYAVTGLVDHEKSPRSVAQTFLAEICAPRASISPRAHELVVRTHVRERA
jgi:hypothetical protein